MVACPFPKAFTADLRWLLKCVLTLGMDPTFLCVPFQPCLFFSNIIFKGRQKTLSKRRQNPFYFQFDLLVLCLRRFCGGGGLAFCLLLTPLCHASLWPVLLKGGVTQPLLLPCRGALWFLTSLLALWAPCSAVWTLFKHSKMQEAWAMEFCKE